MRLRKIASRWVPHHLTDENRLESVRVCKKNLSKFRDGPCQLCDIINSDESWFYLKQISSKQANDSWVYEDESPRTVTKSDFHAKKFVFSIAFKSIGLISI